MMLSVTFEYAMWAELIPVDCNPMELVRVKNALPASSCVPSVRAWTHFIVCAKCSLSHTERWRL
jgi:hypothetical protein